MPSIDPIGPRRGLQWLNQAWSDPDSSLDRDPPAHWPYITHRRLVKALSQVRAGVALSAPDLISLLRPVIRAESVNLPEYGYGLQVPSSVCGCLGAELLDTASMKIRA